MGAKGRLTSNCCTVDEPVAVLPLALVTADCAGVNHSDRVVPVEGDGGVSGSQCEFRGFRDFYSITQSQTNGDETLEALTILRDDLTRGNASETIEVSSEDCRRFERRNGDGDELRIFEVSFDAFQLELGGLSDGDGEESAGDEEGAESHGEGKLGKMGVISQEELSVFPIIFQVITTHPPPLGITGGDGDDGDGRTATATLWPRACSSLAKRIDLANLLWRRPLNLVPLSHMKN